MVDVKALGLSEQSHTSKDGLYCLDDHGLNPPEWCDNDNGIYFNAILNILKRKLKILESRDNTTFLRAMDGIKSDAPGIWARKGNALHDASSHDNDLGVFANSAVFKDRDFCHDWVMHGLTTGYTKDQRDSKSCSLRWNRQPNLVAMMKLGAGLYPAPWEWAHVYGANLFSSITLDDKDGSNHMLEWVRCEALSFILDDTTHAPTKEMLTYHKVGEALFEMTTEKRWSYKEMFENYFHQSSQSPIRLCARALYG